MDTLSLSYYFPFTFPPHSLLALLAPNLVNTDIH